MAKTGRTAARLYDPTSSGAKLVQGSSWRITYGDGDTAAGQVFTDKVTIGGLTVQNQSVQVATKLSGSFTSDNHRDGMLGLAFIRRNTIGPKKQPNWFDNVRPQLAKPLFTCSLDGFSFGSGPFHEAKVFGIVDTGSSLWYMPASIVDLYWKSVQGATFCSQWVFPCDATLPDISLPLLVHASQ
jgi:Eukaryotic aspartyl protease